MSYNNNWVNELKESYLEEKKARQVIDEQVGGSRGPNPQGKPVKVKPATGRVGKMANQIAERGREELTKEDKAIARGHMIKLYGKGTVTFESHSGGHFVEHESEGGDAHAHTFNPVTGKISKTPHVTSSYYGESVTILDQMHLGRGGTYDHVEHEGNNLQEEMALNEHLLMLIDVLCEELDIDVETLLEMAMTKAGHDARVAREYKLSGEGKHDQSWSSQDRTDRLLRSDKVHDEKGKVVHRGARGLGYSITATDPSDKDVETVRSVVGEVGHIVGVANDDDYATGPGDTRGTVDHPVYKRLKTPLPKRNATSIARSRSAVKKSRKSK